MTYKKTDSFLGKVVKRLSPTCAQIAYNTDNTTYEAIQYHNAIIALRIDSTTVQLNTNGWRTATTKKWINKVLPSGYRIYQKAFQWFVSTPSGNILPYTDHMVIQTA